MKKRANGRQINRLFFCFVAAVTLFFGKLEAQNCPSGPYQIGTSNVIPPCLICADYSWGNIERFSYSGDTIGLNYGNILGPDSLPYHDQWLDIYTPVDNASGPFPLFIFAHSGSQYADDAFSNGKDFAEQGISFISWESAQTSLAVGASYYENDPSLLFTFKDYWDATHADFQRVLEWVWENGDTHNIDLENVFVGGGSRGTRISFKGLDQASYPIKGVFMTQAFADGDWYALDFAAAEGCPEVPVTDLIGPNYPPIVMHYKGIMGDVVNAHDPLNGVQVAETFQCFGIENRVVYGLGDGYQWAEDAIEFVQTFDSYFENYPDQVVDMGELDTQANVLLAADSMTLTWNDLINTEFSLTWLGPFWTVNMQNSPYVNKETETLNCEVRIGEVSSLSDGVLLDPCNPFLLAHTQDYDYLDSAAVFHFPETGFQNSCMVPNPDGSGFTRLEEGIYYGAQLRCNLSPESNYFQARSHKFWTPWSALVTFESRCINPSDVYDSQSLSDVIQIFPNPVEEILIVRKKNKGLSGLHFEILDVNGICVAPKNKGSWDGNELQIDTSRLKRGLYWLRLSNEKQTTVLRFYKN